MSHRFSPQIIKENDIRGKVGFNLFPEDARALGRVFGAEMQKRGLSEIVTAFDGRLTSPELHNQLQLGLREAGIKVNVVGRGPSPLLYFAVKHLKLQAGIMVTGSHNPKEDNGFKMILEDRSFFGSEIKNLAEAALSLKSEWPPEPLGQLEFRSDLQEAYIQKLLELALRPTKRPLKIVWDPGNGALCDILEDIIPYLPGEHIVLNGTMDGTFPGHHPDPTVEENLENIKSAIQKEKADIGFAFDGDGDRIGIVDDQRNVLWGDQMLIFFAQEILSRLPGAPIIADVKASQSLFDEIKRMGGTPVMWKTGHSFIKTKMVELDAPLAGEMSGHIFFKDGYYGYDDALYAALRFVQILGNQDLSLSSLRRALPQAVNTPEIRFDCPSDRKFALILDLKKLLDRDQKIYDDTDGVRVLEPSGWWLLRASNTQDVLVARVEASDVLALETLKKDLNYYLEECGIKTKIL